MLVHDSTSNITIIYHILCLSISNNHKLVTLPFCAGKAPQLFTNNYGNNKKLLCIIHIHSNKLYSDSYFILIAKNTNITSILLTDYYKMEIKLWKGVFLKKYQWLPSTGCLVSYYGFGKGLHFLWF